MRVPGGFASKLTGSFVLVLVVFGGTTILSIRQLTRSAQERETVARQYLEDVIYAERLRSAKDAEAAAGRGYLLTRNPDFLQRLEEAEIAFDRALGDLRSRVYSQAGRELLANVLSAANDYTQAQHRVLVEKGENTQPEEVRRQFEREVVPMRRHLSVTIDSFVAHKDSRLQTGYAETRALTARAVATSTIVLALGVLASAVIAWSTGRHLARTHRREQEAVRSAERALAARDELLGIVAHDLRSPLSAIIMKAAILRKASAEEKTRKHAESIESVAMRMAYLIKSLLDTASIESGKFSVSPAPCDVEETLREATEVLDSLATPKSIRLEPRLKQPVLAVMADRDRVIQVLINLIGNAIKFVFEGGKVDITAERDGNDVRFSVADTGPGIAPLHLPHIFDRFWKAETGGKKGTGLGLYIAKGIVEAHGGRIWVESQLGYGATFHFTLPFTDARPSLARNQPDDRPSHPPPETAQD